MPRNPVPKRKSRDDKFRKQQAALSKQVEIDRKLRENEDYIVSRRHHNSLKALMAENEDGVSDTLIQKVMCLTRHELEKILERIIKNLGKGIGDENV